MLMALDDPKGGPILVLAPKQLLQWQDELMEPLSLPSARWNCRAWVDENDGEYAADGMKSPGNCPTQEGIIVRFSFMNFRSCSMICHEVERHAKRTRHAQDSH